MWVINIQHWLDETKTEAGVPQLMIGVKSTLDGFVKSPKRTFPVIPAKAGIQYLQIVKESLLSGFHWSYDFLRDHHS